MLGKLMLVGTIGGEWMLGQKAFADESWLLGLAQCDHYGQTKRVGAFWYDSEPTTPMIQLSIKREVSDLAVIDLWARSDARVVVAPESYVMLRSGSVGTYFLGDIGTAHEDENKINVREARVSVDWSVSGIFWTGVVRVGGRGTHLFRGKNINLA
ncbi:hypothetical protein BO99DRAFT_428348 [Aspergillus violaceofuscus CBS 115571]|uniref:Uncharacterized protein n=1 Tax=Aspergillus violaceofuscus (strain CBS 115571) TaxID=1450538 RepID=A0A2V5HK37_ASPV1|nr:hypothetical protein BO99DRAFT_428348 [Aspergillus violaceofuscus CBS 115571]